VRERERERERERGETRKRWPQQFIKRLAERGIKNEIERES